MYFLLKESVEAASAWLVTVAHLPHVSPCCQQEEVIPAARELGIGIVTWAPMGAGFLTGCDNAWHLCSTADPTLWLGGAMSPADRLTTRVTWSTAFSLKHQ